MCSDAIICIVQVARSLCKKRENRERATKSCARRHTAETRPWCRLYGDRRRPSAYVRRSDSTVGDRSVQSAIGRRPLQVFVVHCMHSLKKRDFLFIMHLKENGEKGRADVPFERRLCYVPFLFPDIAYRSVSAVSTVCTMAVADCRRHTCGNRHSLRSIAASAAGFCSVVIAKTLVWLAVSTMR